jgi:recombination protein RecA
VTQAKAIEIQKLLNAKMGANTLRMGNDPYFVVDYLSTGIIPVDDLFQGGLPLGRFVEIYGDYSSLKSYIGLSAIAHTQRQGGVCALVDTEHAYDPSWAAAIGVDVKALLLDQSETGEAAIDNTEILLRQNVTLIVFDSIAAALPKQEAETQLSGKKNIQPARLAQLMSLACRKLTAANAKTSMLWINQTRSNVGVTFGNPETIPGGKSMPYYASMRMSLRKSGRVTEERIAWVTNSAGKPERKTVKVVVGQNIRATLEKSKLGVPHSESNFVFNHRTGRIDEDRYVLNKCIEEGLVLTNGKGIWWVKNSQKKVKGLDTFVGTMMPEIYKQLGLIQNGKLQVPSRVVVRKKPGSSKPVVLRRTPAVAAAKSVSTGRTIKRFVK